MSPEQMAELIMTELRRQHDDPNADPWGGGFFYDTADLTSVGIDGRVDIMALAGALTKAVAA